MRRIVLLSLAAAGCASSSAITPGVPEATRTVQIIDGTGRSTSVSTTVRNTPDEAMFAVPAAEVWRVLPAAFDSIAVPVSERNAGARTIGNSGFKVRRTLGRVRPSRYFDCGETRGVRNADDYELHVSVMAQAHEAGADATRLTMSVQAMAKPTAVSGEWLRCSVTGALQTRLVEVIDAQIKR